MTLRNILGLKASLLGLIFTISLAAAQAANDKGQTADFNPDRNAYFGDLHIHTKHSFDAFIFNVRTTPDDAYKYAKGEAIMHPAGFPIRLTGRPLDFIAVTDHASYLGILPAMADPDHPLSKVPYAKDMFSSDRNKIAVAFGKVASSLAAGKRLPELSSPETVKSAWKDIIDAANRHYEPGKLTTFIGYEFTSAPQGRNLHRNVIFRGADAPDIPYAALDSQNPEDLWKWLDSQRAQGIEGLAIPHNSNGSNGTMFERTTYEGAPLDAVYANLRMRNEPIVEITQVKGTSETHPILSRNDEWADFELMETYIGTPVPITKFRGGYARDALLTGIQMEEREGFNPYKFGMIGASDSHNAGGPVDEDRYFAKVGVIDGMPEGRGSVPPGGAKTWTVGAEEDANIARFVTFGASGLAGVWAEENTRDAIYGALRRKETFATSGPRIRVRFFGGSSLPEDLLTRSDLMQTAYEQGVSMGGELKASSPPRFLAWAVRDSSSGWLQRLQIVKGWISEGERKEKVFDVACSDGLDPDPKTHRCPDNGATVDLSDCRISEDKGAVELKAMWQDPKFDPSQHAFYYVRVLENPSCRWSTWDALRAGTQLRPGVDPVIQERAWSSPIWITPEG